MTLPEPFELEMLGAGIEKRYRRMRPEVERMPWGSIDVRAIPEDVRIAARSAWTTAAFQEYRTGLACAITLEVLLEAHAPLDLIALASRFPLDELVHVELCSRMAMELGGGTELLHEPDALVRRADMSQRPLLRAADLITRFFCVGETLSIPLLRGTWRAARHPLARAVLGRIVRDEAAHGTFGYTFLDWALPALSDDERAVLGRAAGEAIASVVRLWDGLKRRPRVPANPAHPLAWMETDTYLALARRSLETKVLGPLRERGIAVSTPPGTIAPS